MMFVIWFVDGEEVYGECDELMINLVIGVFMVCWVDGFEEIIMYYLLLVWWLVIYCKWGVGVRLFLVLIV